MTGVMKKKTRHADDCAFVVAMHQAIDRHPEDLAVMLLDWQDSGARCTCGADDARSRVEPEERDLPMVCRRCGRAVDPLRHARFSFDVWPSSMGKDERGCVPGRLCGACASLVSDALVDFARSLGLTAVRFGLIFSSSARAHESIGAERPEVDGFVVRYRDRPGFLVEPGGGEVVLTTIGGDFDTYDAPTVYRTRDEAEAARLRALDAFCGGAGGHDQEIARLLIVVPHEARERFTRPEAKAGIAP